MSDKIVELFTDNKNIEPEEIQLFLREFNYIRLNKDKNGNLFNAEHLRHYAESVSYLVTVMNEYDGHTWLYNFEVPQNKLSEFLSKFQMLGVSSKIIDIEKRLPENFA